MSENTTSISEHDREELILLYEVSVKDIAFFKKQQWVATNYAIALYVAIVALTHSLHPPITSAHKVALFSFLLGTLLGGIAVVLHLQHSIEVRRARLQNVRGHFGSPFAAAWGALPKKENSLHFLLLAVLAFGFLVDAWLVCEAP